MDSEPLASRIRPQKLDEFIGQEHLVGKDKPLRIAVENKQLFSMIFWGPPGVGKTTLAKILAKNVNTDFIGLSAVSAGKDEIKEIVKNSQKREKPVVVFLDEIHRFNKAQQDFLLPFVESGVITLIGSTTENPSFEVIPPLLSRCRVFVLNELNENEIAQIIDRAIEFLHKNLKKKIAIDKDAKDWLVRVANGDARQAITIIENAQTLYQKLTLETLKETLQSTYLRFDKKGEEHYNTVSAFIKSMRASNPDAALYYLARMVEAGEDPKFIARRMVIFASEDIGMAQPTALVVANEVFRAVQEIGYPECAINLAHGTVYLSLAKKDRSAYNGLRAAQEDVRNFGNLPIPLNIRNAPTRYNPYTKESLLPDKLKNRRYF